MNAWARYGKASNPNQRLTANSTSTSHTSPRFGIVAMSLFHV